jgi:hypothetical protein
MYGYSVKSHPECTITPFREEMGFEALRADGVACPELSRRAYFSLFPRRTVAEFLCGGISDTEKFRNIVFFVC